MKNYLAKVTFENASGDETVTVFAYRKEGSEFIQLTPVSNEKLAFREPESFDFENSDIFAGLAQGFLDYLNEQSSK